MLTFFRALWAFLRSPIGMWLMLAVAVLFAGWRGYNAIFDRGVAACERDHNLALAESVQHAAAQAREIALQDAEVISWADRKSNNVYVTLRAEHENTTYADCGLTPAGRVLYNKALRAATNISDTSEQVESGETADQPGVGDAGGNPGEAPSEHGESSAVGNRPGSGETDAGSAWVIGGGY